MLPSYICFACCDTGIVSNHDRAINDHLPDYDMLPSGELFAGSDPAVICCCLAAYSQTGQGGGYRDSEGPNRVHTAAGARLIGCELPQDAIHAIHQRRRQLAYAAVAATAEQAQMLHATRLAVAGLLPSMGSEER